MARRKNFRAGATLGYSLRITLRKRCIYRAACLVEMELCGGSQD